MNHHRVACISSRINSLCTHYCYPACPLGEVDIASIPAEGQLISSREALYTINIRTAVATCYSMWRLATVTVMHMIATTI